MTTALERAAEYHEDRGAVPSLSSTIARLLVSRTPAHAKAAHPRLSPDAPRKESAAMDMGTAVHQLLLRDDRVDVLDFKDYKTDAAKEAKAESRANGRVPMLTHQWEQAQEIAVAVRERIVALDLDPVPFTDGTAEHVIRWDENGVACRAMLDWLRDDRLVVDDLKTTSDASPRGFQRKVWNLRYDVQAAMYVRAVTAEYGVVPRFRWIAVETEYPYLVTVHEPDRQAMVNAHDKVVQAVEMWQHCLETGEWRGYPAEVCEVGPVPWERDAWADLDVDPGEVPF